MAKRSIGKLSVILSADTRRYAAGLNRGKEQAKDFGKSVKRTMANVKRVIVGLGAVAIGGGVFAGLSRELARLDEVAKVAGRLGSTTEELSRMQFAAQQTGVGVSTLNMALQRMTRRVAEAANGSGEAVNALKELGLDAERLARMTPGGAMEEIADAMQRVGSQGDRVRLAMKLFDSEGVALVNTLAEGAEGLRRFGVESDRLGNTVDSKAARAAEDFNDAVTRLKASLRGTVGALADDVVPAFTGVVDKVSTLIGRIRAGDAVLSKSVLQVGALVSGFAAGTFVGGKLITLIGKLVTMLRSLAKAKAVVLAMSGPKGWLQVTAGLAAAGVAVVTLNAALAETVSEAEGVSEEVQRMTADIDKATGAVDDMTTAALEQEQALRRLESRAATVYADTRTEAEQTAMKMEELNELLERGLIGDDTFARAVDKLKGVGDAGVDAVQQIERAVEDLARRTDSVLDLIKTDAQRLEDQIANIVELASLGQITNNQAQRAIDKLASVRDAPQANEQPDFLNLARMNFAALGAEQAAGRRADVAERQRKEMIAQGDRDGDVQERTLQAIRELNQGQAIRVIRLN
ncbi:MAG: hypothetical protein AAGH88_15790 [Planctomycetota bacterium]